MQEFTSQHSCCTAARQRIPLFTRLLYGSSTALLSILSHAVNTYYSIAKENHFVCTAMYFIILLEAYRGRTSMTMNINGSVETASVHFCIPCFKVPVLASTDARYSLSMMVTAVTYRWSTGTSSHHPLVLYSI